MGTHVPIRECICCRSKQKKSSLYRIVKQEDGFFVDHGQKMSGRGAYICGTCLSDPKAFVKRPLDRAFRQKVPQDVYEALRGLSERVDEP